MPMTAQYTLHDHTDEARAWIYDCFDDAPADLTDTEVLAAIERYYDGGIPAFLADVR